MAKRRLSLTPEARNCVLRYAQASRSREACGVLLAVADGHTADGAGTDVVTRAVRVPNRAADPARAFLVSPVDLARVERAARPLGLRVIGTWHTHPHGAPEPSRADRAGAPDGWWQALAGSVHSRTVLRAFWVENGTWIPASC